MKLAILIFISLTCLVYGAVSQSSAYDVILQSAICKKLKVKIVNYLWNGLPVYAADSSIPNNTLNNSYFKTELGLEKMTFAQGMDFIKKILHGHRKMQKACVQLYQKWVHRCIWYIL